MPEISVVLPVYNGERYLGEALDSILGQTLHDFELIAVDDGSTDATAEILDACARRDRRVRVLEQPHLGLIAALNRGLDASSGDYVARMDADDVSLEFRLERQLQFMKAHPSVGVCGAWIRFFGAAPSVEWRTAPDHGTLVSSLLFESSLAHPTVMLRRELFGPGLRYDPSFPHSEDYDLWERASRSTRLANVQEVLLLHRIHDSQVTKTRSNELQASARAVRARQFARLGVEPDEKEARLHNEICLFEVIGSVPAMKRAEGWLRRLRAANDRARIYPEPEFSQVIAQRWVRLCAIRLGPWTWMASGLWRSPLLAPREWVGLFRALAAKRLRSSLAARVVWRVHGRLMRRRAHPAST